MQFIDMHCDSLMMLMLRDPEESNLYDSKVTSVDFGRMQKGGQLAQFFAVFMPPVEAYGMMGIPPIEDEEYISGCQSRLLRNVEEHKDIIGMAYTAEDIEENRKAGKMSAVLTMEDGRSVQGKMENLDRYYQMGFRAIALTWNKENCFGFPNSQDPDIMNRGLTSFGKEAVEYMQELGILVDVSHLSDGGFYDVASICKKPFVATHSNCRAVAPHQRNLTDDMIRTLANAGGVAGINFGPEFLNPDSTCMDSTCAMMAKQARHMADVGGIECVGIGSDLDGIEGNLEISDCSQMGKLEDALVKEGFTENEIEKIFYRNVLRVMHDAVK